MILFLLFINFILNESFHLIKHKQEKRIAYIYDVKDITKVDQSTINNLQDLYKDHPLLIFKDLDTVSPNDFLHFMQKFNKDNDVNQLKYYQRQTLQISNNGPPLEKIELFNLYNLNNININSYNSIWNTDLSGCEFKLSNIPSAFYIMEESSLWGKTDFISCETIYENLDPDEQLFVQKILIENNNININVPLVYQPYNINEKPKILIMPSFFKKIIGWGTKDSRNWITNFMEKKVLPHQVNIEWSKGDLAIFNNNRFMHTSTPGRNYIKNKDDIYIPINKPLLEINLNEKNIYSSFNIKWIKDEEIFIPFQGTNNKLIINKINKININKKIDSFV